MFKGTDSNDVTHGAALEQLTLQDASAAALADDIRIEWNTAGEATSLYLSGANNLTTDTTPEVTLSYGALGNVFTATSSAGAYTYYYDHAMRRVLTRRALSVDGSNPRAFYGLDHRLLNERRPGDAFSSSESTEYVWLNGEQVGLMYTHSTTQPTTVAYFVYTDRMGVPREYSTNAGARVQRLVTEPFGRGTLVDDNGTGVNPPMNLRYPGQYFDVESGLINNRWRTVIPQVGMFSSPEPLYSLGNEANTGPQAYAYAVGRPQVWVDPTGLYTIDGDAWGNDEPRIHVISRALEMLRQHDPLNCYYVRTFGHNPIDDKGWIRPNDFWNPDTMGRTNPITNAIYIDPAVVDAAITSGDASALASLLAHEMVHGSFDVLGHDGPSDPYRANSVFEFPGIFPEFSNCGSSARCERSRGANRFCAPCL